ncbi:MAG: 2,3,4,5-tetrahydropyridine-2,6-dicarboxylate N-succinyltransferase, partial [Flavobacterium sp.]
MISDLKKLVEAAWEDRSLLAYTNYCEAIEAVILRLDKGELRVAEPVLNSWGINEWIKKAVILYFPIKQMKEIKVGPFVYHDKMELKTD